MHASFELRQGVWHVMALSKNGVSLNSEKIAPNTPCALKSGDVIELGGRRKLEMG